MVFCNVKSKSVNVTKLEKLFVVNTLFFLASKFLVTEKLPIVKNGVPPSLANCVPTKSGENGRYSIVPS